MNRREQWRKVLDVELQRWSDAPYEQLVSALRDQKAYEIEFDSKLYQVEIELLEDTAERLHVMVAVDDGSLPASMLSVTDSFLRNKPRSGV